MKQIEMRQKAEMEYRLFPYKGGSVVFMSNFQMNCSVPVPHGAIAVYRLNGLSVTSKRHLNNIMSAIACMEEWGLMAVSWKEDDGNYAILTNLSSDMPTSAIAATLGNIIAEDPEIGNESPLAKYIWLDTGEIICGEKELES